MRNRGALVVGCRQIGVLLIASVLVIGGFSQSFGAISYTKTADAAFGGPMTLTATSSAAGLVYTVSSTVSNTGLQTLPDIEFVIPFAWANQVSPGNEQALTWNTSSGSWTRVSPAYNLVLSDYSLNAGASTAPVLFPLNITDVPTSLPAPGGGEMANVLAGDSVPGIDLGSFAPGQSKTLVLTFPSNIPTHLDFGAYFLAPVPEPSTLALLSAAGIGLLTYSWRRRWA